MEEFDFGLDFWTYDNSTPWFLEICRVLIIQQLMYLIPGHQKIKCKIPTLCMADQLGTGNLNRTSTLFAYKGDYLAFREISLSYHYHKQLLKSFICRQ